MLIWWSEQFSSFCPHRCRLCLLIEFPFCKINGGKKETFSFLTAAIRCNYSSIIEFPRKKNRDILSSHSWWMAPLNYFFFFEITPLEAIRSAARARCSDLDARVRKEVWQLFCVLIWKRQRSVFAGRRLATKLQRREISVLTDSLFFSGLWPQSHVL